MSALPHFHNDSDFIKHETKEFRDGRRLRFLCAASLLVKHGDHVFHDIAAPCHGSEEESSHSLWVHRVQQVQECQQSAEAAHIIPIHLSDVLIKCTESLPVKLLDVVSTLQLF